AGRLLPRLPGGAAQTVKARRRGLAAQIFRDAIEPLDRQVELVAVRVLEEQEIAFAIADLHRPETEVAPEAVVLVDDDVVDREIAERGQRGAALVLRSSQRAPAGSKDFRLGEHDDPEGRNRKAGRALADDHRQRFG